MAAALKHTIANNKYYQPPHPPPLRKPSPSLVSRFQHKYPDYHLWEKEAETSAMQREMKLMNIAFCFPGYHRLFSDVTFVKKWE